MPELLRPSPGCLWPFLTLLRQLAFRHSFWGRFPCLVKYSFLPINILYEHVTPLKTRNYTLFNVLDILSKPNPSLQRVVLKWKNGLQNFQNAPHTQLENFSTWTKFTFYLQNTLPTLLLGALGKLVCLFSDLGWPQVGCPPRVFWGIDFTLCIFCTLIVDQRLRW